MKIRERLPAVATAILSIACTVLSMVPARAAEPLPESVLACRNETEDAKRLACFDREVARYAITPEERFGLRAGQAPPAADDESTPQEKPAEHVNSITATVTAISRRARGEYVLTLDNGQVWAQTQEGSKIRFAVGDSVSIRSAAFGSFLLTAPRGGTTRVERVR